MEGRIKRHGRDTLRSLISTTLFCLVIALVTQSIWPSSYLEHMLISFSYGYSAVFSAHIIAWFIPNISTLLTSAMSLASSMCLGTTSAYFILKKYDNFATIEQLKPVIVLGFVFTCMCFVFFYAHEQRLIAQRESEVAKRKQSEHEKAMVLSQLRQLQSQIEPHFLFNTLANVSVLIEQEPKLAKLMLEKLTDLLRGTLKSSRQESSSLQSELELVDAYLAIQQIRLGARLEYKINNTLNSDITLPPMVLQPLVENAIQHGIEPKVEGGWIHISAQDIESHLVIEVEDSGVGIGQQLDTAGHGVGLDNTKQRLLALFGPSASLSLLESSSGGVKAKLTIPITLLNSASSLS
ncbi:sensor histidine kinase [Vibrio sinaloensis]|uniref:sensor histidine kinase n=1 Tax=Photobacterium sp. (strain ATCC 43367) TaxID=379097 RepID=UPI0035ECB927